MSTHDVLIDVAAERLRQEGLKASGKFPATCADDIPAASKFAILVEEVGEVARAINDGDPEHMREELVQVAAVAVAWVEALSRVEP
ncbi:MAG: hypothetical protein EBR82_87720 [Caulobacteraceae bacterium]|nr:hypothetical protein [Caulobacteraceae bacterium]